MNCNFYWQTTPISVIPSSSTYVYFDPATINYQNQSSIYIQFEQLKKKCQMLELDNSRLKEEILILERINKRKHKRIVKRRKEQQLDKKFKCSHFNCRKEYASALALNLHMKTKHNIDIDKRPEQKKNLTTDSQNSIKHEGQNSNTRL